MKTKFIFYISALFLLFPAMPKAQTVVIKEDVTDTTVTKSNWEGGFFADFTFYGGFDQKGLDGTLARSLGFSMLPNLKYNFNERLGVVMLFGFSLDQYGFKKSGDNVSFPDSAAFTKNRFTQSSVAAGLALRYKFNTEAYLQLGAFAKWNVFNTYQYQTSNDKGNTVDVVVRNPGYFHDFSYDAYVRLGVEGLGVLAYYRLSDMFVKTSNNPMVYETPRLRIGIGIGL